MKQKKTNLRKLVHVYESLEDATKQFNRDVQIMSKDFVDIVYRDFDMKNPYDQTVLEAILTNLLAYVEVYAEMDNVNMEKAIWEDFGNHLERYRKQVKENQEKGK